MATTDINKQVDVEDSVPSHDLANGTVGRIPESISLIHIRWLRIFVHQQNRQFLNVRGYNFVR